MTEEQAIRTKAHAALAKFGEMSRMRAKFGYNRETVAWLEGFIERQRRREDIADDLYTVLNRVQENLLRGGLTRRAPSGRLTRTRRVTSIRKDVKLNSQLWDLATDVLAA